MAGWNIATFLNLNGDTLKLTVNPPALNPKLVYTKKAVVTNTPIKEDSDRDGSTPFFFQPSPELTITSLGETHLEPKD